MLWSWRFYKKHNSCPYLDEEIRIDWPYVNLCLPSLSLLVILTFGSFSKVYKELSQREMCWIFIPLWCAQYFYSALLDLFQIWNAAFLEHSAVCCWIWIGNSRHSRRHGAGNTVSRCLGMCREWERKARQSGYLALPISLSPTVFPKGCRPAPRDEGVVLIALLP